MQERELGENYIICLYGHIIKLYTTEQRHLCKESVTQSNKCNQSNWVHAGLTVFNLKFHQFNSDVQSCKINRTIYHQIYS